MELDRQMGLKPPSPEFMQGVFSGVNLCLTCVKGDNPETEIIAQLLVEMARRYLEAIDVNV